MSMQVLSPGPLTTVQDLGREGWRHLGVGIAGALDPHAHTLANLLVGNAPDAATLEITLAGPRLRFAQPARVAWCGADIDARCDGIALPRARPVLLPAGSTLALGACRRGARAWLAIAGGIDVEPALGSRATDLRGGFGGLLGRALQAGDVLPIGTARRPNVAEVQVARWWIDDTPEGAGPGVVRVLPGADASVPADALTARAWQVAAASDRQGLRLAGSALRAADAVERISAPVAPGTVQLPPDGQPIVLLADAQTHGGYPRIAHVIRADRPLLAQLRPGERVRFVPCTPSQARAAWRTQRQALARLALAIRARVPAGG
jgi:antagonist of KipI